MTAAEYPTFAVAGTLLGAVIDAHLGRQNLGRVLFLRRRDGTARGWARYDHLRERNSWSA